MKCLWFALAIAAVMLASCNCVKEGVVIAKHARKGLPRVYATSFLHYYDEPDVYWIEIESRDGKSRPVRRNVILFRNDWSLINLGDRWSCGQVVKSRDGKN